MDIDVRPLSTHLGAEVRGLDLNEPLGDNVISTLREIWHTHGGFMVIRGQENLTTEAHIAFGAALGPLFGAPGEPPLQDTVSRYMHPDYPEIYRVSNKLDDRGEPLGRKRCRHVLAFRCEFPRTPGRGLYPSRDRNPKHRWRYDFCQYDQSF